jgi:hypothetical protein
MDEAAAVTVFRTVAAISAVSSAAVAGTCLLFESLRKSFFTRIILMIALSDVGVSAAAVIGFPNGQLGVCALQAVVETFSLRANWMWTTMLVFQMYRFILFNKVFFSEKIMHVVVWGLSTLLTFLPLIHGKFGRDSTYSSGDMCFITSSDSAWMEAWILITFLITLWICIFAMFYFISTVYVNYRNIRDPNRELQILGLVKSLYLYPVVMMLTWGVAATFNTVYQFASPSPPSTQSIVLDIVLTIALSNGFWISMVFFYKSPEARRRWKHLFTNADGNSVNPTLHFEETTFSGDLSRSLATHTHTTTSEIWRGSSFDDSTLSL